MKIKMEKLTKQDLINDLKKYKLLIKNELEIIDYFYDHNFILETFKVIKTNNNNVLLDCGFVKNNKIKIQFYFSNITTIFYCYINYKIDKSNWIFQVKFCDFELMKNWIEKYKN